MSGVYGVKSETEYEKVSFHIARGHTKNIVVFQRVETQKCTDKAILMLENFKETSNLCTQWMYI